VTDPRKAPYPQRVEFEYDGTHTLVSVDGQPWGRVEQVSMGYWRLLTAGRPRTRAPIPTSELRTTVERIAFKDRKETLRATPRSLS
jgi:hypothetical protein